MSGPDSTVVVTLRSSDGLDSYEERRFILRPGMTIPIGRASKNTQKPELMVGSNNAFIDSPVVSREHAVLSADTSTDPPVVYITDRGSMHGTKVNGKTLDAHTASQLHNGDKLQFGIDVTRNESFFVAHQYLFESTREDSFSHGFAVPDMETSEEEDIEADDLASPPPAALTMAMAVVTPTPARVTAPNLVSRDPPRYGSQTNPVTIDDSEEAQPTVIEILDEVVVDAEPMVGSDETDQRTSSPPATKVDPPAGLDESLECSEPNPSPYAFVDDHSSDDEENHMEIDYSSEEEPSEDESNPGHIESESDDDSDAASASASASDFEAADGDNEEDLDAARRSKLGAMLDHVQHQPTIESSPSVSPPISTSLASPALSTPPQTHAPRRQEPAASFGAPPTAKAMPRPPRFDAQAMDYAYMGPIGGWFDEPPFGSTGTGSLMGSPLPPRPAAPKPMHWGAPDFVRQFAPRDPGWFPDELPTSSLFSPPMDCSYTPQQPLPLSDPVWAYKPPHMNDGLTPASAPVNHLRTPPPVPASDLPTPPQPARRTKVSIPEIVEDAPQHPPTPTSVTGSLKRKADTLDEEIEEVAPAQSTITTHAAPVKTEASSFTQERPKKRLRTRLGGAVKAAAYLIPAVLTVGALTTLPEGFWQP